MNLEAKTVSSMIRIYCHAHHSEAKELCAECAELLAYAEERIENCPFGGGKPVCNQCTVHCYKPELRDQIKTVMRYAGPRMLWWHPVLAIRHLLRLKRTSNVGL